MDNDNIQTHIVPRTNLDFGLDGNIPRYWLDGNPFKTRLVDSLSMTFPIGERFFISSVRRYRDQITGPQQLAEVRDFMRQEGQHGIVHNQWNDRLREQGVPVDAIEQFCDRFFKWQLGKLPQAWPLVYTASIEHLTAILADTVFGNDNFLHGADERMRAVFAWHAIEEFEHKAVAFDVMQKTAKVGYFTRAGIMVAAVIIFQVLTLHFLGKVLKADGFSFGQRAKLWASGLWWLYKPAGGVFAHMTPAILQYFKPGFHPTQIKEPACYRVWNETYENSGDPLQASRSTMLAA